MAQTLIQVKDLKKYYNGGDVKALTASRWTCTRATSSR